MKRNILFLVTLLVLAGTLMLQSCKEEEGVITSYGAFTQPALVAPANDAWISVSGTTVTLQWSSSDSDGDPEKWDIYFGTSHDPDLVKANHNAQSYTVTVAKGNEYFWRVVGTDSRGIPTRSEEWSFKVLDPAADMTLDMSWATDVESSIGLSLDPDEVVDLRLLILKESDRSKVAVEDGASFETFADFNTLPDGSYLVATDIYATINAGDFNAPVAIDITLDFMQPGIINTSLAFPQVMDNMMPCEDYFTVLAKVVKVGTSYTITKDVAYAWSTALTNLVGNWKGIDNFDYESQIVTSLANGGTTLKMDGIGFGWIEDWWGETVQSHTPVTVTIDWNSSGAMEIEDQYHMTTLWAGDLYDYNVVGFGSFITCGDYPVLILSYDLVQDGWSVGSWLYANRYAASKYFETTITLDPNGFGGGKGKGSSSGTPVKRLIEKPVH
jgi:hypothetical protein